MIINKENYTFTFSDKNKVVHTIKSGDTVVFETYDCMCNQITHNSKDFESLDFDRVNPATGPVFIEGAEPNKVLKIKINSINLQGSGVVFTGNNLGVLGKKLETMESKIINIKDNKAIFNDIELPLNKMIGVIGVAPENNSINCGTPGSHGGNMDCKIIGEGSIVYLPIFCKGALLSMGDVHALMGDGEIGVSGAEIGAQIEVKVEVIDNAHIKNPIIETDNAYYTIGSAVTLDKAYEIAAEDLFELLYPLSNLSKNELIMLMSMTCDLEICQVVDPLKTIRFKINKELLPKIGIDKLI